MATNELEPGIHDFTLDGFIEKYCITTSNPRMSRRWYFADPLKRVCEWAELADALYILIGGSFVSSRENPSDLDLIVVFNRDSNIKKCPENLLIQEVFVDIQYLSNENTPLLDAFIYLLAHSKSDVKKGVVRIALNKKSPAPQIPSLRPEFYQIVRDGYDQRSLLIPLNRKGVIVPIHGVNTHANWLSYFSLLASNAGWGVAPFVYGREWVTTLVRKGRREKLAEELREWLIKVRLHYNGPVGIFSHSLGTYIFAKYLELTPESEDVFFGVVLAGSILNTNFDWPKYLTSNRISALCNTHSSRDHWVNKMPDGGMFFCKDSLYGNAGNTGFSKTHNRIFQYKSDILNHVNMFEEDEIKRWLDFFEISAKLHSAPASVRDSISF